MVGETTGLDESDDEVGIYGPGCRIEEDDAETIRLKDVVKLVGGNSVLNGSLSASELIPFDTVSGFFFSTLFIIFFGCESASELVLLTSSSEVKRHSSYFLDYFLLWVDVLG